MDKEFIHRQLDTIEQMVADIRADVGPLDPPPPVYTDPQDLSAALDMGGEIVLNPGATYEYPIGFQFKAPTVLKGSQREIGVTGGLGPTLYLPPHGAGVQMIELAARNAWDGNIIQLGRNDTLQTDPDQEPNDVILRHLVVLSFRGKRAVEVNARNVLIEDCHIADVFDPAKRDSQAIGLLNSSGGLTVRRCHLEAASETFLAGGDTMKMVGIVPQGVLFEDCTLTKKLEWKGDPATPVKNIFELKNAWGCIIRRCLLYNCWPSGQAGEAFMFTPKAGGQVDVTVEDCTVRDVSRIVNITGKDNSSLANPNRTKVMFMGGNYQTNKIGMGGDGRFCLVTGGPESLIFRGIFVRMEGSSFIDIDSAHVDYLEVTDSDFNIGNYGIRIGGLNHGDNSLGIVGQIVIERNRISGASSAFKARYPNNVWL